MPLAVGIRREDKNPWERRAPLTPPQVARLVKEQPIQIYVQPSAQRVFSEAEYRQAGAIVQEDLSPCKLILGVKEIPQHLFEAGKTYLFFSHTIKGQAYNMPMLKCMMDKGCQLIDYERIADEEGRRLVLFGRHAGLAGMIESLQALGKRLAVEGVADSDNPLADVKQPYQYRDLPAATGHLQEIASAIRTRGLPKSVTPLVVGVLGYGNVSRGVQEILDCLPCTEIAPASLADLKNGAVSNKTLYKVVFREEDTVERLDSSSPFVLNEYYQHPERYRAAFSRYLPHLTVLINAIYWDQRFPVLVSAESLQRLYAGPRRPALRVIGDITCDIEGSIAVTRKSTLPDQPCYVYDTVTDGIEDGVENLHGPVIMAVDILPTEFPVEASSHFGTALQPFLREIASSDFSAGFAQLQLPAPIKNALILLRGELTEAYRYLEGYLQQEGAQPKG